MSERESMADYHNAIVGYAGSSPVAHSKIQRNSIMKSLGADLSKVKPGGLPEEWQEFIAEMDRRGEEMMEENARRAARAMKEANDAWEEGGLG